MALNTTPDCFGATNGSILSLGGTVYYRFNRDWFGIGSAYVSYTSITAAGDGGDGDGEGRSTIRRSSDSPALRVAYRF